MSGILRKVHVDLPFEEMSRRVNLVTGIPLTVWTVHNRHIAKGRRTCRSKNGLEFEYVSKTVHPEDSAGNAIDDVHHHELAIFVKHRGHWCLVEDSNVIVESPNEEDAYIRWVSFMVGNCEVAVTELPEGAPA